MKFSKLVLLIFGPLRKIFKLVFGSLLYKINIFYTHTFKLFSINLF